ncbi:sororin [Moschus berezovskii]|uniref:sororin n=1 Tax=Moschus berezovskii TaxID=68408 RepID=UPI0024449A91|nr:sororin [Moschus berezovskii]
MSERRTRSGGAAQCPGPSAPTPTRSLRRSQRKSGSDLPNTLPEISPKAPQEAPVRKPIVLKKIVAHTVEVRAERGVVGGEPGSGVDCVINLLSPQIPSVNSPRRSPRIAFLLEKENNPLSKKLTKEDHFQTCSVPVTAPSTPVLCPLNAESNSWKGDLDARDLEMSKKVRRSYSRLETLGPVPTSTPGRRSCFGFEGLLAAEDLAGVSPVVDSKLAEVPRVPVKPWTPDTTLPGISPLVVKEKRRKKKVPEILCPWDGQTAHLEPEEKSVLPPAGEQKPEDTQISGEPDTEPSFSDSSEQKLDQEQGASATFLFTLLTATATATEPASDPAEDLEIQESQFLDKEDWGPHWTSKEMRHLLNVCLRLRELLSTIQANNLALREKLRDLPDSLYESLKEEARAILEGEKVVQEEGKALQEEGKAIQEGAHAVQEGALFQVPGTPPSSGWGERTSLPSATQPGLPCLQQPSSQMAGLDILQPDPALNSGNTCQP